MNEHQAFAEAVDELVTRIVKARADLIDAACEQALTGGTCGVSVYRDRVIVDPLVPYGVVHYHERDLSE